MKPELYHRLQRFSPDTDPAHIVKVIRENILQIDKKCRSRIRNKMREAKLRINKEYYLPYYREDSQAFREALVHSYKKLIEKKIKTDAVEHYEFQTQELQKLTEEKKELEQLARARNYERKGAGFTVKDGHYYVYVTTPPYALKSPHVRGQDCYVPFEPAQIGVRINYQDGRFMIGTPRIMHKYRHPFTGNNSGGIGGICLGRDGNDVAERALRLRPAQAVIRLLDQGKKTIMMGYRSGSNPHISLSRSEWRNWMTKRQIQRKGLVCLNEGW